MELLPVCTACAASATAFNCHGTCRRRESSEDGGLTRGILPETGREDVAHDAFVDLIGIQAGALHRFAHYDRTQLRRAEIGETALKLSYCSATTREDDNIVESRHRSCSREDFATPIIDAWQAKTMGFHRRFASRCQAPVSRNLLALAQRKRLFSFWDLVFRATSDGDWQDISPRIAFHARFAVTLVHQRKLHLMHFFLDFIFH